MPQSPSLLYQILEACLAAKRKPWKPKNSVRILFDSPWKEGNELFDWYNHHTAAIIETMQLRKEREPPFFHEYITFSLRDNAGCFRIDRHQRPNETHPLAAMYNGVEAYDTINRIRSLDDRGYGDSDCLIQITFCGDAQVHLVLLLKICRAIAQHQLSRVYTLQRYSCTFYSQTIISCILQKVITGTVQGHAGGLANEMAINSDALTLGLERSTPPSILLSHLPGNYPAIDFVTHEDQCSACWKSALARRAACGSTKAVSLGTLSNLFWDGVVRVAEHYIQFLDVATDAGNGSWFLCPRFHLVELCQELTYRAIHDTWDTRLRLFERNLVCLVGIPPRCKCSCRESDVAPGIQGNYVGYPAQSAVAITTNICSPTRVDLEAHYPEIAKFLRTNISDVQQDCRNIVSQTCQKSKALHNVLSTYYQGINRRVAIQVNVKYFGRRQLGLLASRITHGLTHSWPLSNSVDELTNGAKAKSLNLVQESRIATLHVYMLLILHAHSVRVESFRSWLRYDATEVVQDIAATMKDIWKLLNEQRN